jgi:ABC-2 type transport system permease protein
MSAARTVWAFVALQFRSLAHDRSALFFMVALPVVIIVVIGSTFGGAQQVPVGLVTVDAPLAIATGAGGGNGVTSGREDGPTPTGEGVVEHIRAALEAADGVAVRDFHDLATARAAVRSEAVAGVVVVPDHADVVLAAGGGVDVAFMSTDASPASMTARVAVQGVLDQLGAVAGAARLVASEVGSDRAALVEQALDEAGATTPVSVVDVGGGQTRELSAFSYTAPQNLVLFVFISALAGAAYLVAMRRNGIVRRIAASPTRPGTVVLGVSAGWFAMALVQSLIIIGIGGLVFGVRWGDPLSAVLLTVSFAAVGAAAGLLLGALGRDEDKVGSLAPIAGIVLGALGGCTIPAEIFPPPMLALAHAVPHYWAMTAWQTLIFDGGGLGDIAGSLAILVGFAAVLWLLATMTLRRQLVRG